MTKVIGYKEAKRALNDLGLREGVHFKPSADGVRLTFAAVEKMCDWVEEGISEYISEREGTSRIINGEYTGERNTSVSLRSDFLKKVR